MSYGSETKTLKLFELNIPQSLDWELIKTLEKSHQDSFESAWVWGVRWHKVLWYFPLFPFALIAFLCFAATMPPAHSMEGNWGWVMIGLIWTFVVCFWSIALDQWLDISWRLGRVARRILAKFSNRYRFWIAIKNAVVTAHNNEVLVLEASHLLLSEALKRSEEALERANRVMNAKEH